MAADDPAKPAPVVLRIKLRYEDIDALVERFAPNVGKSGLFLPTRSLRPVGTEVRFELRLANDTPAIVGLGKVRAVREPDPANPKAAFGMAIELMRVTRESREIILRMLERRRALGLGDTALPIPDDAETSRRAEVESTAVRDMPVPGGAAPDGGAPLRAREPAEPIAPDAQPTPVPIIAEPVFTAPRARRSSIGIAVPREARESSTPFSITPLPAEVPRPRRPRLSEVMAAGRSAGREAAARHDDPIADEQVDVAAALARARALAGADLDGELAALRDQAAAPIEISIEAASAELARQLGGQAVKRDRSARWAPPPPSVDAAPAAVSVARDTEPVTAPIAATIAAAVISVVPGDEVTPVTAAAPMWPSSLDDSSKSAPHEITQIGAIPTPTPPPSEITNVVAAPPERRRGFTGAPISTTITAVPPPPRASSPSGLLIDDHIDADAFRASVETPVAPPDDADDPDPDRDRTQFTQVEAAPFERREPEAAEAAEPADVEEEINDFEILAEADADDADLLNADGEADASGGHRAPHLDTAAAAALATAVAAASAARPPTATGTGERAATFDFAARLDLGDDDAPDPTYEPTRTSTSFPLPRKRNAPGHDHAPAPAIDEPDAEPELDAGDLGGGLGGPNSVLVAVPDPHPDAAAFDEPPFSGGPHPAERPSAGHAMSNYDDADGDFGGYTDAIDPDSYRPPAPLRLDSDHAAYAVEPLIDSIDAALPEEAVDARASEPYILNAPAPGAARRGDDYNLDAALDSLDIDLDDLSAAPMPPMPPIPDDAATPPRGQQVGRPVTGRAPVVRPGRAPRLPRATTEDGVMIDFDDDDDK